jgi:hypothetical protein
MPCFLLLAAAAASAATPLPAAPGRSETRTVIDAQLAVPPREGPTVGLTAGEAAVIEQHYLQSIGKRIEKDKSSSSEGSQSQ